MKILKKSENMDPITEFNMLNAQTEKMKEAVGADLEIGAWLLSENEKDGEVYQVLTVAEAKEDGFIYSTSSEAFIETFMNAIGQLGNLESIRVESRKAKKTGREYLTFKVVK